MHSKKTLAGFGVLAMIVMVLVGYWLIQVLAKPKDPQVCYIPTASNWAQTEVGYVWNSPPPWPEGNCLSLYPTGISSGVSYHVVNMHAENFGAIVRKLGLNRVQVRIVPVGASKKLLIIDPRIPREWFLATGCPLCAPPELFNQLKARYPECFRNP